MPVLCSRHIVFLFEMRTTEDNYQLDMTIFCRTSIAIAALVC